MINISSNWAKLVRGVRALIWLNSTSNAHNWVNPDKAEISVIWFHPKPNMFNPVRPDRGERSVMLLSSTVKVVKAVQYSKPSKLVIPAELESKLVIVDKS